MEPEIREYSGYLTYSRLGDEALQDLRRLIRQADLKVDAQREATEIEYAGRDTNRRVVRLLAQMAKVIGDANGEVRCRTEVEDSDPECEFYSIREGKLLCQRAHLVREPAEVVASAVEASPAGVS
jgi:hypothetical protein